MSNYTKATNFASKDALTTGNPLKTLSGTEIDDEFTNIATAIATKANASNAALTGTPVAPTASVATDSTQVATTAFVQDQKASPVLTGTPTAPTASVSTDTTQLATTAFVQAAVTVLTAATVNALVYPVGSIYTAVVATNPATLLGVGTWVAFGTGRTLVGIDTGDASFNVVEEVGGSKTDAHTLTTSEIPSHNHASGWTLGGGDGSANVYSTTNGGGGAPPTGSTGGGAAHTHDIVQPYIVVYFWKRTV